MKDEVVTGGSIAAGGTLGILIPPSIMLILMASYSPVSVGALFAGALVPGLLLGSMYALYVLVICLIKPDFGPPVGAEERAETSTGELVIRLCKYVLPPMSLILGVLGALFTGIATATEASAIGAALARPPQQQKAAALPAGLEDVISAALPVGAAIPAALPTIVPLPMERARSI